MASRSTMATFITRTSAGQEARLNQLPFLASVNCYTQCNSNTAKGIVEWQPCESAPADHTSMAAWKCVPNAWLALTASSIAVSLLFSSYQSNTFRHAPAQKGRRLAQGAIWHRPLHRESQRGSTHLVGKMALATLDGKLHVGYSKVRTGSHRLGTRPGNEVRSCFALIVYQSCKYSRLWLTEGCLQWGAHLTHSQLWLH